MECGTFDPMSSPHAQDSELSTLDGHVPFAEEADTESAHSRPVSLPDTAGNRLGLLGRAMYDDQWNFYDADTLGPLAIGLVGAAVLANANADREYAEDYQEYIRSDSTDSLSRAVKWMGDGRYTIPIYGLATVLSVYAPDHPVLEPFETWGQRSLRATVTGALPLWFLQRAIGTGRPGIEDNNSRWVFFDHANGVSGHAFMSAVPFMTAARMVDDPRLKVALYLGAGITGWSRINDDDHYISQVLMGWLLAYLSVQAVFDTDEQYADWRLVPIPPSHGQGVGLELRY